MIGKEIGHYRIDRQLGKGGMGEVYAARDTRLQREVAVKFLPADLAADPTLMARFEREARVIASLNHPNIVSIHSIEDIEGRSFLTMEMVDGETLAALIPKRGFPLERFLEIAIPIVDALSYSHKRGVTHRDLKPANIMVDKSGNVKVLDFGLARLCDPEHRSSEAELTEEMTEVIPLTEPGRIIGTIPYMSPEQVQGHPLDSASDVFSLGVVLHEMATGRRPFTGESSADLMSSILRDDPPSISTINPGCPLQLDRLLKRCLEKNLKARFQTAGEVRQVLGVLQTTQRSPDLGSERPSIGVLPFTDMSPGRDQQFFCDGIAEEISTSLTKISGLRVAARSSAFSLRDVEDIKKIGEILDTGAVLQGSLRMAGNRLRVTAELSDTRNGFQLWSENYDRDASDLFAVQDDIALAIAKQLSCKLISDEHDAVVKRHTENREAYSLYLKGRYHWNRRYAGGLQKGMEYFQQALQVDPLYSLPHCGLADSFAILGFYNIQPPAVAFPMARSAARQALDLDELLADAHASLGLVRGFFDWDWRRAEAALLRSLELSPELPMADFWYAFLEMCLGRPQQSLRRIAHAQAADPLSPIINGSAGYLRYFNREPEQAVEEINKVLEMEPGFGPGLWFLGLSYMELGRFDEAAQTLEESIKFLQNLPLAVATLGIALARGGRQDAAVQTLQKLAAAASTNYVSPYYMAALCLALKRKEETIDWLTRAFNDRNNWLVFLKVDPLFDDFRSEPEYESLVEKVGLDDGFEATGPSWIFQTEVIPREPG